MLGASEANCFADGGKLGVFDLVGNRLILGERDGSAEGLQDGSDVPSSV